MEYNEEIKALLEGYHDKIETEIMPKLTQDFTIFYVSFTELCGKLKGKGLLKNDPYFKDSGIMELVTPDTEPFTESDAHWKVAERITHYDSILSFITHNYSFSLNTFNFSELEKMKKFLEYYNWRGILNPTMTEINTQSFGKILINYRNTSNDSLVINTFDKCLETIIKSVDAITTKLRIILIYLKESYKLFIRMDIVPIVIKNNPEATQFEMSVLISDEIKNNYSYLKTYTKFISEVVDEEFSAEGVELKDQVIKRLTLTKKIEKKDSKNDKESSNDLLLLLLEIGKIRNHLSAGIEKLYSNHINLTQNNGNLLSRFFRKITGIMFNITPKTIYELKIKNKDGGSRNQTLHFELFYDEVKKLEYNLINFAEEDKIQSFILSNENTITKAIDKIIVNIKKQVITLIALDDKLKSDSRIKNIKAKGIKPELTVIKTLINSSTSMYRDYLDKLGSDSQKI